MTRYVKFEDIDDGSNGTEYDGETFSFTSAAHVIDPSAEDLKADNGNIYETTAHNRHQRRHFKGPRMWEGSMDTLLYTKSAPTLLYYALGGIVVTELGTGVNLHKLKTAPGSNDLPHFIAEIGRDVKSHQYNGCTLNAFSIDFDPGEAISANFDIMARKELSTVDNPGTTITDDYDVKERGWGGVEFLTYIGNGGSTIVPASVSSGILSSSILTTTFDYVEKMSLKFDNNFAKNNVLGDRYNKRNFVQDVSVTGTFEFGYDPSTQSKQNYTDVIEQNDKSFIFRAERGFKDTRAEGVDARMICLRLPRVSYDTSNIPTTNNERYVQSIDWTAQTSTDSTDSDEIYIDVVNAESNGAFTA